MSKARRKAEKMEAGAAQLESALERTQKALEAAERVDAAGGKKRSGKFFKLVLLLTIAGVAVVLVRKAMGDSSTPAYSPAAGGDTSSSGAATGSPSAPANGGSPSAAPESSNPEADEPTA